MGVNLPILYTFIRCPYAMRARLALAYAQIKYEPREVDLSNKPAHLLEISPKGTVPVLLLQDKTVLEQSLDIMRWALKQNDPQGLNDYPEEELADMENLITANDTKFTKDLNHYKYPNRYPDDPNNIEFYRANCAKFIRPLEQRLSETKYLFGDKLSLADFAVFPFVRQFSIVDPNWFASAPFPQIRDWLENISNSQIFETTMQKFAPWVANASN